MPTSTARDRDPRLLACVKTLQPHRHAQGAFGRIRLGSGISNESVRDFLSTENHCSPIARPGMRLAASSSGRRSVATT